MAAKTKTSPVCVLAVDDEVFNLDILHNSLKQAGYDPLEAENGEIAWNKLQENREVQVIVLDRMMPVMDGMAFLKKLKADWRFRDIPVIMQTAAAEREQIIEGINAGVYYYLTKPYEKEVLLSIVKAALEDAKIKKRLQEEVRQSRRALGLMEEAKFHFRTLEEVQNLAYLVANCFPDPERVVYGIHELMTNAVEHGNLGIGYAEKAALVKKGTWVEEIRHRLELQENRTKYGILMMKATPTAILVKIRDQGEGFNWKPYLQITPERAVHPHGRGIATARLCFDEMTYEGKGNEVLCKVSISAKDMGF